MNLAARVAAALPLPTGLADVRPRCVGCGRLYTGALAPRVRADPTSAFAGHLEGAGAEYRVADGWGWTSEYVHARTTWRGPYCPACLHRGR